MEDLPDVDAAKNERCRTFADETYNIPRCYIENTTKEELVLEHVLEYNRQFKIIYDPTRELLLAPVNECNKRKFICTTIRPTKLPYTDLYEWENCAKFISNYLEYEELAEPDKLPYFIPSPANVLDWQAGDCFDFAIVLCSLLIGSGYDAYVVYGTAPKQITTKDESLMECPLNLDIDETDDPYYDADAEQMSQTKQKNEAEELTFKVEKKAPHRSEYDDAMDEKKKAEEHAAFLKAITIDDDEPDYEQEDNYGRSRVHAWVLLNKGQREMQYPFFIEPTTGRRYEIDNSPYYSIQAIFNH